MREWWSRLKASVSGRRRRDDELDQEIQAHLEMEIEDAVARGVSPQQARRRFGNVTAVHERSREAWGFPSVESLARDIRYGLRMMRRSPAFTAAAVLSLGLGIGANTAIYSVIDALFLRRLPVDDPGRLVTLKRTYQGDGRAPHWFNYRWYERFRDLSEVFSGATAIHAVDRSDAVNQAPETGDSDAQLRVRLVTGDYFSVVGVRPQLGRAFTLSDDQGSSDQSVAVISHAYWGRRFAFARDIVGRTIRVGRATCTITEVTPQEFTGEWIGRPADVWVPVAMATKVVRELPPIAERERGAGLGYYVLARLKSGIRPETARAAAQLLYHQILEGERADQTPRPLHGSGLPRRDWNWNRAEAASLRSGNRSPSR
ncbi:MAG: ABC transporter permease [Bryobacteraceae bacterium]